MNVITDWYGPTELKKDKEIHIDLQKKVDELEHKVKKLIKIVTHQSKEIDTLKQIISIKIKL